ncbi:ABC transporter permease subunit [uncultured Ramlibacter sp.]|uniref:amino acid ABC transporter permease n=1 Tax=uncultured Ramlibacter sp. TaxID=260755 RepID=UPI0026063DA0|nr:ABC transporter permease subunit [uncultured Ramlibacter sp.]
MPGPVAARRAPAARRGRFSWRSRRVRALAYQLLAVAVIGFLGWLLVSSTLANMRLRGIQSGFDFLLQPAGFDIGEGWVPYDSVNPYWRAFLVGVVNTLRVAVIGCLLATLLGTLLGIGRFSRNALVRGICYGYVELFRNIPVLLQLLMWYLLFTEYLPPPDEAWRAGHALFLSKNGISFPALVWESGHWWALGGLAAGCIAAFAYARVARAAFERSGKPWPVAAAAVLLVLGLSWGGWLAGGAPAQFHFPEAGELQVEGGSALSPEYMAVLLGLVLYTAAFIAEVVRAGIASVPRGQHEAAASIGLPRGRTMRLVVLPQALRLIIPPLTNQYLNLTKNSSLAVAVGYPDVVSIANTSLNQSGRAVECIAIIMLVYLTMSLSTSAGMNWFNRRAAIKER